MRIAHLITRFIRGGADENTLYSCNGQAALGHDVLLVHGDEYDEPLRKQLDWRVVAVRLPSLRRPIHPLNDWQAYAACVELFRKWRPDLVHTHTSKAGIVGRWAAWRAKVPVIIHGIHILPHLNEGWLQRQVFLALERATARITDAFVNVGGDMMEQALRDRIGRQDQHLVIPSGMDLEKFRNATARRMGWKKILGSAAEGLPEAPRFIVLVSRLEQRKGQSAFLEVFQRIARRVPQAVLLLAGEGPERAALEARVKELNLYGRVVFAGFRDDVENLLSIAEVGLLTSRREGLPRVIIQYALAGLPVVATDIPGVREVIEPGVHGFTAPPDDLSSMEEPLVRLLTDEVFREEMVARIRGKDFSAWSIESMVDQLDRLYRKLAAWSEPTGLVPLPAGRNNSHEGVGEKAA